MRTDHRAPHTIGRPSLALVMFLFELIASRRCLCVGFYLMTHSFLQNVSPRAMCTYIKPRPSLSNFSTARLLTVVFYVPPASQPT